MLDHSPVPELTELLERAKTPASEAPPQEEPSTHHIGISKGRAHSSHGAAVLLTAGVTAALCQLLHLHRSRHKRVRHHSRTHLCKANDLHRRTAFQWCTAEHMQYAFPYLCQLIALCAAPLFRECPQLLRSGCDLYCPSCCGITGCVRVCGLLCLLVCSLSITRLGSRIPSACAANLHN